MIIMDMFYVFLSIYLSFYCTYLSFVNQKTIDDHMSQTEIQYLKEENSRLQHELTAARGIVNASNIRSILDAERGLTPSSEKSNSPILDMMTSKPSNNNNNDNVSSSNSSSAQWSIWSYFFSAPESTLHKTNNKVLLVQCYGSLFLDFIAIIILSTI